jgi:hypothetical protein
LEHKEFYQYFLTWLHSPIAAIKPRSILKSSVFIGVFVYLFLVIYQPFGSSNTPLSTTIWVFLGYGFSATIATLLAYKLSHLILNNKPFYLHWSRAKHVVFLSTVLLIVGPLNYGYFCWSFNQTYTLSGQLYFYKLAFLVSLLPIVLLVFNKKNITTSSSDAVLNDTAANKTVSTPKNLSTLLTLTGKNQNEILTVNLQQLLFIKAADNYCECFYVKEGQLTQSLLRASLADLETQIPNSELMRCHRSYLVNPLLIKTYKGNAQGYKLWFEQVNEVIPVSRRYIATIKPLLLA